MATVEVVDQANGTGSASTISFTSIPADFKHLQAVAFIRSTYAAALAQFKIKINGNTTGYYAAGINSGLNSSSTPFAFAETSAGSEIYSALGWFQAGSTATADAHTPIEMWFANYAESSTKNCGIITWRCGDNNNNTAYNANPVGVAGWFSDTAETITSIEFIDAVGNFTATSWITLYGWRG